MVVGHGAVELLAAPGCSVEVHLAHPFRELLKQLQYQRLPHLPAVVETEYEVVGMDSRPAEPES